MTEEEQADFLKERCASLERLMPMSTEDFDEEIDELTWQWGRHLLPYTDKGRHQLAAYKRRTILRQKEFYQKIRLFKPMAIKYPTLMKRLIGCDITGTEEIKYKIHGEWIANEEKIAGFTYEDLAVETNGGKFTDWDLPKVDDVITGFVVDITEKGAFIDIGAKAWAFMPLDQVSLVPISNAAEVLSLGQEVECKVIAQGSFSRLGGDPWATQFVVSATALESGAAWEKVASMMRGEADTSVLTVTVMAMKSFGAVVMTEQGLEALVPNSELMDRAGDTSLVGMQIQCTIKALRSDMIDSGPAFGPMQYPLILSYKSAASRELYDKHEEGEVLTGTVKLVRDLSLDVLIDNIQCSIRKVDISGKTNFTIPELFEVGEVIKCVIISKAAETGEIRLSMRALERKRGEMLEDKAGVFERAEVTAQKYLVRATAEKQKALDALTGILEEEEASFMSPKVEKKPGAVMDLDDDDDDIQGF